MVHLSAVAGVLGPDSTAVARPPKPAILFNERFTSARREEECYKKNVSSHIFLFTNDYPTVTSGWQGPPYFRRRYGRELVSKTATSVKEYWGGCR